MSYAISLSGTTVTIASPGPRGVGVPDGGTTGQTLQKASDTNYDFSWADINSTLSSLTDTTIPSPSSGDLLIYDGDTWYNQPLTPPIDYVYGKSSILAELKTTNAKVMFVGDSISQNGETNFTTLWHAALFAWHPDQWGGAWFRSSAEDVGIKTLANAAAITEAETDALPGYDGAFANRTNLRGQYSSIARGGETINSTAQTHQITFQRSSFASNNARPALLERFDDGLQIFEDADGVRRIADGTTTFRFGPMFFGYGTTNIVDSVQLRLTDNGVTPGVYETNALTADADAWTDAAYNEYAVSAAGDASDSGTILQVVRQTTPADGNYLAIQAVFVGREEGTTISYVGYGGWNVGNHSNAYPNGDEFTLTVGGTPYTSPWSYSDEHITARMATEGTTHLFLHIGANDLDATETDAGVLMGKIEDLVDRFSGLRSGIKFVFTTIYTTDNDTSSIIANREDFNRRLRTFCWGRDDCVCVDLAQYIADTYSTHAAFSAAWLYDDVHPNTDGAYAMQSFIWDRVVAAAGGVKDIVEDTTPQLGGDLDVNGNAIVSVSNGDIAITPDGTGAVVLDGLSWPTADGSTGQYLKTDGAGALSFGDVVAELNDLTDVSVGSEQASDVLVYRSGSGWINDALDYTEITSNVGSGSADHSGGTVAAGSITDVIALTNTEYTNLTGGPDANTLYVITDAATSIADADDVTITSAATNDFLVVDASGDWVDKTPAQVRGILDLEIGTDVQAYSDDLASIASLTTASDRLPYFSGAKTASLATFTAFGRSLVDDADAAAGRTTLGLGTAATSASTDFVAASAVSTFGGTLIDDADAATARTTLGLGTASTSDTGDFIASSAASAFGLTLLDDTDAATARSTLGLVIDTDVQAYDAELAAIAGLTSAAGKAIEFTGSGTAATFDITTAGKALLDDADASAQRTTLGLGTLATASTITDSYVGHIEAPEDTTYYLDPKVAEAREITGVYFAWTAGASPDGDIDVQIGGTSVLSSTGRMNSGSSFTGTLKTDGTEDVAADAVITVVLGAVNGVADVTDLRFSVEYAQ